MKSPRISYALLLAKAPLDDKTAPMEELRRPWRAYAPLDQAPYGYHMRPWLAKAHLDSKIAYMGEVRRT